MSLGAALSGEAQDPPRGQPRDDFPGCANLFVLPKVAKIVRNSGGTPFDVIAELTERKDWYVCGEDPRSLSILVFPQCCRTNVDRLRARVTVPSKLGIHPTIAASIWWGVETLSRDPRIQTLRQLKARFDHIDRQVNGEISALVSSFFRGFEIELPLGRRQNVQLPKPIYDPLYGLAHDLEVTIQSLAVVATMLTLSEQRDTNEDDAKSMRAYVESFLRRAEIRGTGAQALMDAYDL